MAAILATAGRGILPFIGGIGVRLIHQLPGKSAEGYIPYHTFPLINYRSRDSSDPKVRRIASWGRWEMLGGKYIGM